MTDQKHKSQRSDASLTPGEVRIAFPFVHEKRTKSAGGDVLDKPRYDMTVLLPKLDPDPTKCANYKFLADHCMIAASKAWPGAGWPQGGKWPIQDGDIPHTPKPKPGVAPLTPAEIAAKNAWRAGNWVIEVANNLDPGPKVAVMQNGQAIEIPAKVVAGVQMYDSGWYGRVSILAYSFQNKTFGVNFGFEGVLFTRPGERIGSSGQRSTAEIFGSIATVAPTGAAPPIPTAAPPTAAAPQYQPPTTAAPPSPQYQANPPGTRPGAIPAAPIPTAAAAPVAPPPGLPPFPGAR